jgi:hypothetical protein
MLPLMKALVNLGGSASIDEMYEEVVELENFDEDTLAVLHNPDKSSQTEQNHIGCPCMVTTSSSSLSTVGCNNIPMLDSVLAELGTSWLRR